jgi:hypothetical protein
MTLAKAKAKTNETVIVQASLTIVTYDHQNMFIVQATGHDGWESKEERKNQNCKNFIKN